MSNQQKQHYYWLDWMKAIGMFFIVAGHLDPIGYQYIYVFSVPLFFIMSGFLAKHEDDEKVFWIKIVRNLIIPCILICLIMHVYDIVIDVAHGEFTWGRIPHRILNSILGIHGKGTLAGGLGLCWFIYTLVICRILYQYTFCLGKLMRWMPIVVCIAIAIVYNMQEVDIYNSFLNTTLAYPLYVIGERCKLLYNRQSGFSDRILWLMITLGLILVITIGIINGAPWMYKARYGKNLILFFIGGNAGSIVVFAIASYLQHFRYRIVDIIAKGTILILGFQFVLIRFYYHAPAILQNGLLKYVIALIIVLIFVPIIQIVEKYFPILLGARVESKGH